MTPTREEILSEPAGRQMDAWITMYGLGDRWSEVVSKFPHWHGDENLFWLSYSRRYSTDIVAVWQLVDCILGGVTRSGDSHTVALVSDGAGWLCVIDELGDDDERVEGRAGIKEAPLAICRAFLLAKLSEQP
jgi:hypothetical protein